MREGGRKEEVDEAAATALNEIGMTITHEGRPHNLSVLPPTHTHKTYPTSSDRQPHAAHTAVSAPIG